MKESLGLESVLGGLAKFAAVYPANRSSPIVPVFSAEGTCVMKLVVNQKPSDFQDGLTIAQLLVELKLDGKPVAVEVNEELVPGECHSRHKLSDGDQLEIVTLAGGG